MINPFLGLIKPEMSVLSLFSAAFGGQNDVLFLKEIGCKDVTLVDLAQMELLFLEQKTKYKAINQDCFKFIEDAKNEGKTWNVVISDQWTHQDKMIHEEYFPQLNEIATDLLILGICKNYIDEKVILDGEFYSRSNHLGGVFWRILKPKKELPLV